MSTANIGCVMVYGQMTRFDTYRENKFLCGYEGGYFFITVSF
jgi:hypothetical protein